RPWAEASGAMNSSEQFRSQATEARADAAAGTNPPREAIVSLTRGLDILRCFRPGDGPLTVLEIARRTGLPRQSVNRLVYSLAQMGCLERRQADGRYQVGRRMMGIGQALLAGLPIREIARPVMQRIADAHNT